MKTDRDDIEFVSGKVDSALQIIRTQGYENIWLLGGGVLVRAFMEHGLIDEYIISILPILLGEGISLFGSSKVEEKLELIGSHAYPGGLVQLHYRQGKK